MTHEEISLNTKQAFASALKELMKKKPLNKITVKDLTEACALNRKTFYYHFSDIYALLKWMLEEEAINIVNQFDMLTDFRDAALFVLNYIEANEYMLNCVYDSMGRDELKNFLYSDFMPIVQRTVDEYEKELALELDDIYKYFICVFYSEAIVGVMLDWIRKEKKVDKETAVIYMDAVLFSSVPAALKAGEKI